MKLNFKKLVLGTEIEQYLVVTKTLSVMTS